MVTHYSYSKVQYDTLICIVSLVQFFGEGTLMAKSDIKDAFRIVPINPLEYHLLGFTSERNSIVSQWERVVHAKYLRNLVRP